MFSKNIPLDSPCRDASGGIVFIFQFYRLHKKNGGFPKKSSISRVNGRIRKKNTWTGRTRNRWKLMKIWPLLHGQTFFEQLTNYFLIIFLRIDREMFALSRRERISSVQCIEIELSIEYKRCIFPGRIRSPHSIW